MRKKRKYNDDWVTYLLENETRVRNRLELYLMTDNENSNENLGIVSSKTGRETENKIVKKITNKNYEFRKRCLKCLEEYFEECSYLEQEIWTMRFKLGYSCDRVGREIGYEKTTVYNYLKKLRDELNIRISKIEREVFQSETN